MPMSQQEAAGSEQCRSGTNVSAIVLGVIGILCVYILSPAPVEFVLKKLPKEWQSLLQPVFQTFYLPIIILYLYSSHFRAFWDAYTELFGW